MDQEGGSASSKRSKSESKRNQESEGMAKRGQSHEVWLSKLKAKLKQDKTESKGNQDSMAWLSDVWRG